MREFVTTVNASLGTLCLEKTPMKTCIDRINAILAGLKRVIKTFFGCYYPKGIEEVELLGEDDMGLNYRVYLPELGDVDVVSREISLDVDGEVSILRVSATDKSVDLPTLAEGVVVSLAVRDTDDAGNVSDWSEVYNFHTRDTIRPSRPGVVKVELLAEVSDPVPSAPEPEPPAPEPEVEPDPEDL